MMVTRLHKAGMKFQIFILASLLDLIITRAKPEKINRERN